jgi:uncharacterized delta-60 repeat protein
MALARYEPDGSLDPTFGNGGKVTTNPKLRYSGGASILLRGKIVVAGSTHKGALALARFDTDGRLDSTFGKQGVSEIKRISVQPGAVLTQSHGRILVAATTSFDYNNHGHGVVARLLPSGRLDPSFGEGPVCAARRLRRRPPRSRGRTAAVGEPRSAFRARSGAGT